MKPEVELLLLASVVLMGIVSICHRVLWGFQTVMKSILFFFSKIHKYSKLSPNQTKAFCIFSARKRNILNNFYFFAEHKNFNWSRKWIVCSNPTLSYFLFMWNYKFLSQIFYVHSWKLCGLVETKSISGSSRQCTKSHKPMKLNVYRAVGARTNTRNRFKRRMLRRSFDGVWWSVKEVSQSNLWLLNICQKFPTAEIFKTEQKLLRRCCQRLKEMGEFKKINA